MIDLHLHTNCSDGTLSPEELVALCSRQGICTIAISDHDTLLGYPRAAFEGERLGIEVIPAVEMSAGGDREIHILGYYADPESPRVQAMLKEQRERRKTRGEGMIRALQGLGVALDIKAVQAAAGEAALGRPHIGAALVKAGVVGSMAEAFDKYLAQGRPAYIPRENPPAGEMVRMMREAGMIPVLAHGALYEANEEVLAQLIYHLADCGLMGLECYHSGYTHAMERFMRRRAEAMNLLITGGSDFHGAHREGILPGSGLARWKDAPQCLKMLKLQHFRGFTR